jgi:zinc/manganese transport system substrate-binding protein
MFTIIRSFAASCFLVLAATLPATAQTAEKLKVVATFSVIGDLVRQVGGDRVEAVTLVGPDGDAHVYSPTPADGRRLTEAKVVFTNGMKFEGWIDRLVKSSGTKASVAVTSTGVTAVEEKGEHDHGHAHGAVDPHAWQDVRNAKIYVANIRDALSAADPQGKAVYEANAAAYGQQLDALDAEIKDAIARIPADRRRIITSHDAFAYFEKAYGIDFIAPQGVSTESEASAKDVAQIIRQIRREKVPAVFFENISDPRLIERIAKETGTRIGGRLYSDALSEPAGPAGTYIDMMRHNIRAFSTALSS